MGEDLPTDSGCGHALDMNRVTVVYQRALTASAEASKANATAQKTHKIAATSLFYSLLAIALIAIDIALRWRGFS